jgi:hypothetical protein
MKTCLVTDEVDAPRARVLLRLADRHRSAGRFALAAEKLEEAAGLFAVAGDTAEEQNARLLARSLRTGSVTTTSTTHTPTTSTAVDRSDGSDLVGQARYAFRMCHRNPR